MDPEDREDQPKATRPFQDEECETTEMKEENNKNQWKRKLKLNDIDDLKLNSDANES